MPNDDIEHKEHLARIYNAPSSKAHRAEEAARGTTTPRSRLALRQLDEKIELGQQHKREGDALALKQRDESNENARFPTRATDYRTKHPTERAALDERHEEERATMAKRHRAERDRLREEK